jgi:hypothetical protein
VYQFLQVDPKTTLSPNHNIGAYPAVDRHVAAWVSDALVAAIIASGYANLRARGCDKILGRTGNRRQDCESRK